MKVVFFSGQKKRLKKIKSVAYHIILFNFQYFCVYYIFFGATFVYITTKLKLLVYRKKMLVN